MSRVIQLRWSDEDEDTWRDVATSDDPYEKIKGLIAADELIQTQYNHSFHAVFRVKP